MLNAELPTGSLGDRKRGTMPSTFDILEFWEPLLEQIYRMTTDEDGAPVCWSCSFAGIPLQRAHILSVQEGGSDDVSNLHLLCYCCHRLSEDLNSQRYWKWMQAPSMVRWFRIPRYRTRGDRAEAYFKSLEPKISPEDQRGILEFLARHPSDA